MTSERTRAAVLLVLLAAACGHDAPRENPLDPERTPPVVLEVVVHDSTAAVTLAWSPYDGQEPFAAYRVERKVQGQEEWAALDTLRNASARTYVDRTRLPDTAYDYRVVAVSDGGLAAPSNKESVGAYSIEPVTLLPVEEDGRGGTLRLCWTRTASPGFEGYEVLRRPVGTERDSAVYSSATPADTSFTDTSARHGVPYSYTVRVASSGLLLRSAAREATLELPSVGTPRVVADPATATARVAWDPYEGPGFAAYEVWRRTATEAPALLTSLADVTDTVAIDTKLLGNTAYLYEVVVHTTRGEEIGSAEAGDSIYRWERSWPMRSLDGGRAFVRLHSREGEGVVAVIGDAGERSTGAAGASYAREVAYGANGGEVERFGWTLLGALPSMLQVAALKAGDGGRMTVTVAWASSIDAANFYRYRLTAVSPEGVATLVTAEQHSAQPRWVGLALAGPLVLHVLDDQPFVVEGDTVYRAGDGPFGSRASEIRTWTDGRSWRVGVCLPQARKIQWGTVPEVSLTSWSTYLTRTSAAANRAGDPVDYPLSFDFAPDAGLVVLDAGRARVLVLDRLGRYITQFGRFGDGDGEFDFGRGQTTLHGQPDYAGSVAVDGLGNVYVADELNGRIQKFVP